LQCIFDEISFLHLSYNFDFVSLAASSLNCLLRIFPAADLGISATNLTPPVICLYSDTLWATNLMTSSSVRDS
ncbi:hypothetical protein PMAYCL1PPCAC_07294, partial [Pristionchus mayeri]